MTTSTPDRRYPLEPLADAIGLSVNATCRRLRVSGSTQQEYRARGVTERVADRLAVRAGLHPYEVWPEMLDHQIDDAMAECADGDCDRQFVPNGRQRFCSPTCRRRAHKRRLLSSEEGRARNAAHRRAYYAENGAYERARQQRAYWADPEAARRQKREERARAKSTDFYADEQTVDGDKEVAG